MHTLPFAAVAALAAIPVLAAPPVPLQVIPVAPTRVATHGNVLFADFGQDSFGNLKIDFSSAPPSADWKVRLGERLANDGTINRKPGGSVLFCEVPLATHPDQLEYELALPARKHAAMGAPPGIGEIVPFRYAEIEGTNSLPEDITVRQLTVNAPFDDSASDFTSSDATLNSVWNLCKHTMKATTAFGVFIDGDRERKPYEADAYIAMLSHYACDLDPRVARATFDYLLAHPTWPTEWSLVMPMIADADYEATGDPVLAANNYEALKAKLLLQKVGPDGLLHAPAIVDWPVSERDGYNDGVVEGKQVGPDVNTVANAFLYHALQCMSHLASALNKQDDAQAFAARAQQVYTAFNATFFDATRKIYVDGEGSTHASLHANMFPLAFGLVPPEQQAGVVAFVQSRGMACSVYGAQFLLESLYLSGKSDDALALMSADTPRSWAHMLDLGSTMTLEAWDPSVKRNLTWNHAWGAAPANIITRYLLGVRPLEPGYTKILIAPELGTLKWMQGKVPTPRGPVRVAWQSNPASLDLDIPAGATARVLLPSPVATGKSVSINGKAFLPKVETGATILYPLASGHYRISY